MPGCPRRGRAVGPKRARSWMMPKVNRGDVAGRGKHQYDGRFPGQKTLRTSLLREAPHHRGPFDLQAPEEDLGNAP